MQIQVNTDNNVKGSQRLEAFINEKFQDAFARFSDKVTRFEVHLSDQNGEKGGKDDQQCRIEARPQGLQPITVTSREAEMEQAINAAISKMRSALDTTFGKLRGH